ncbi:hypothetical protein LWC05_09285 [Acetobacter sicerae]|uniref:Uncharacterized protein n=1 Tax=Acetobacter sicerae TaxID=85325 RepID=A0ABS8VXI9_9PROT|nr:hypothetical protein [Acetobacter sicerae]MCE0744073.1 hypothetical protein [Acetobacter sicerae]
MILPSPPSMGRYRPVCFDVTLPDKRLIEFALDLPALAAAQVKAGQFGAQHLDVVV